MTKLMKPTYKKLSTHYQGKQGLALVFDVPENTDMDLEDVIQQAKGYFNVFKQKKPEVLFQLTVFDDGKYVSSKFTDKAQGLEVSDYGGGDGQGISRFILTIFM